MKAERLIYTFVSMAAHFNTSWGHGSPDEGVELTAETAHKYGIPVTWIVNSGSIKILRERILRWHDQYGDDVILHAYNMKNKSKTEYAQFISSEWQVLKEAFPWAETKVGASGSIASELIQVLEEQNFQGLWGSCWEQSWWDGITHKGIPWGFWYTDSSKYKAPYPGKGKVVACEWTARDLHLSYHTASPCIYSTDPNDVLRAGLCSGENIEYWKKIFDDYLNNTENNENVFFLQHQEAHEMEVTDAFAVYPFSHVAECTKMLDNFFKYVTSYNITITTLPQAIKMYHEKNQVTAPCYMLTRDSDIRPEINEYTMTLGGIGSGPWPETFFYYDAECQMAFINGECKPRMFRNYTSINKREDDYSEPVPMVFVENFKKTKDCIKMDFKIDTDRTMPFGLVYWDDLSGFSIQESDGVSETRIIDNKLIFMRFNLSGNMKRIKLLLQK